MRGLRRTAWVVAVWTVLCGVVTLLWIWFGMFLLFVVWLVARSPRPVSVAVGGAPRLGTPRLCTTCGSAVALGAAYCPACGNRVVPAEPRPTRHVSVGSPFSRQ